MIKLAKNLELPLDFSTERIAFLARTGAGKSGGMRVMFEQMFDAGLFSIFIDPKGDAWGIRAAGTGKGKPVLVMGGDHGDVPLEATAGKVIAEFLVRERVSTVLDISDFSTPEMWRFIADFTKTLYKLNREVIHVFIDEADMIAGQTYFDPHCLHGIQLIQNKGRARGFGFTVATQRPQILNKTILQASGTLIAMQTIGDDALKVVKSWLGQTAGKDTVQSILTVLPTLKTREAFVYSPQILGIDPVRITFDSFTTYDSMRTPKPGETRQAPKSVADIDLTAVQRDMAATIEKVKAEDPRTLQKRITELEKQLSSKAAPETVEKAVEVPVPVLDREGLAKIQVAVEKFQQDHQTWRDNFLSVMNDAAKAFGDGTIGTGEIFDALAELRKARPTLPAAVAASVDLSASLRQGKSFPAEPRKVQPTRPAPTPTPAEVGDLQLSKKQQEIIDAIAWYESMGNRQPTQTQIGAVALIDPTGGYFSNKIGPLCSSGLVVRGGGRVGLTDAGRALARPIEAADSLDAYHDVLRSRIRKMKSAKNKSIDLLDALIEFEGQPVTTEQIGERIGVDHTGGYFSNLIGPLSTAGLITRSGGIVTPTDVLFPEGLS